MNLQQVDLNLLVILDALLQEQNVTRAAERLHMSQPATSTALSRLRKVLGDELLVKRGRHLQLTPRAESLIDPVRDVLATIEQHIVRPPTFDPAHDQRVFTINASDYVGVTLIRPLLGRLAGLAAGLRIDLAPVPERYLNALQRDEIDLVILPDRLVDAEPLEDCSREPVISDRFVGAVWRGHPAAEERLTLDVMSSFPYLLYQPPGGVGLVERDLDEAGIGRQVEATASSFVAMPFMLAGTRLVTLVPESLGKRVASAADIVLLEPDFRLEPLRQSVLWHARRDRDPGHAWLREQLLTVAKDSLHPLTPMDAQKH
ncbi:LysR family transcriptional regulator [Spirillospora sp. NPDC052242]